MFVFITKIFIRFLANVVNASNHTQCLSLSNKKMWDSIYSEWIHSILSFCGYFRYMELVILLMTCLIKYVFQTR